MDRNELLDDGIILPKKPSIDNTKEIIKLRREYEKQSKSIKLGRYAILGYAALLLIEVVYYLVQDIFGRFELIFTGVLLALFVGLFFLSYKNSFLAFIFSLIVVLGMMLLSAIDSPINLVKGILWKGLIIYFLVTAISPSKNIKQTIASLLSFGISEDQLKS